MSKCNRYLFRRTLLSIVILVLGNAYAADSTSHTSKITSGNNEASASPVDAVFHGELVEDPCIILPSDETQTVDFGSRESKYFYIRPENPVTSPIPFSLKLAECDLTLGKEVKISLLGDEDLDLPGFLKIKGAAKGIAIGLNSTQSGTVTWLSVNKQAVTYDLLQGENTLTFQAYLKGKPKDIENKTIEEGEYSAIVEFGLEYE